jgi:hypothetical protein
VRVRTRERAGEGRCLTARRVEGKRSGAATGERVAHQLLDQDAASLRCGARELVDRLRVEIHCETRSNCERIY